MTSNARDALSPREIEQRSGVSYKTVLREIGRGHLRAKRIGNRLLVPVADYEAWLSPDEPAAVSRETPQRARSALRVDAGPGSPGRLTAIEGGG